MNISKIVMNTKYSIDTEIFLIKYGKPKNDFENIQEQSLVIFTQNSGGGTKTFVNNYILNRSEKNVFVIFPLSTVKKTKRFVIEEYHQNIRFTILPKDLPNFFNSLQNVSELLINSLVECRDVFGILDILTNYIERNKINTILMFHEFFPLCPNYTLTRNYNYCGLNCIKNNCPDAKKYNIDEWRKKWTKLLSIVNEVRTFDESIKIMVQKIYPELNNLTVVPHKLIHFSADKIINFDSSEMRIGVLGKISKIKGKLFLKGFLQYLRFKNQKIYLFGNSFLFSKNLIHTGMYNSENLREKLIEYKINVVLFTSICPETFSYVISELIELNMPIVCFDLGAQANRVRQYERGLISKSMDYDEVYKTLTKCYKNFIVDGK